MEMKCIFIDLADVNHILISKPSHKPKSKGISNADRRYTIRWFEKLQNRLNIIQLQISRMVIVSSFHSFIDTLPDDKTNFSRLDCNNDIPFGNSHRHSFIHWSNQFVECLPGYFYSLLRVFLSHSQLYWYMNNFRSVMTINIYWIISSFCIDHHLSQYRNRHYWVSINE